MNKNMLFGSLTFLFLIVMACQKVVCPEPEEQPKCQLATSRFYYPDGAWYNETYTYNAAGQLTGVTDTRQDGGFMSRQEYIYSGERLLQQKLFDVNNQHVANFLYTYEGNRVVKEEYFELRTDTVKVIERTYEYKNGRIHRINEKNLNVNTESYSVFTHTGNNITRIKTYKASNELTDDVEAQYDDKRNPFYGGHPAVPGSIRTGSANNMTKMIEHVRHGQPVTSSFVSVYKYNANGYPTDQHTEYGNKLIHEQSFAYKCP